MGFHQKCKLAKQCPHESETMPGTCGYHHCRLSREEINELTIGCKYTQEELENRYYEQVRPKINPFIGALVEEFYNDAMAND